MVSGFVKRMNDFLDVEALGDGFAEYALDIVRDYIRDERPGEALATELENIRFGEQESLRALKQKAFPSLTVGGAYTEPALSINSDLSSDTEDNSFELSDECQLKREDLLRFIAEKDGVSISQAREAIDREMEDRRIQELRSPTFHRALLRRYLGGLDDMVSQLDGLEVLGVDWKRIPSHLQTLISNAHDCLVLGQDVACAVLCVAALEEALRIRLGSNEFKELAEGITKAVKIAVFIDPSPGLQWAREIKTERNRAIHEPAKYLAQCTKTLVLLKLRYVLTILFEKSDQISSQLDPKTLTK